MMGVSTSINRDIGALTDLATRALLTEVSRVLAEHGVQGYLVGGFVRDVLLGRTTRDIDIAVSADGPETAERLAAALKGRAILLDEANRVARVILWDDDRAEVRWQIDLSTIKEGLEHDLARRDFTINAIAVSLEGLTRERPQVPVTDPFGGIADLDRHVIRSISQATFEADPVRLLRAVRLAAELDFSIEEATERLIGRHAHLIAGVAGERVREELLRLLALRQSGRFVAHLDRLGLLTTIFPELAEARGVGQPKEHHWDVLQHSLKTVCATDFLLRQGDWEYADAQILAAVPWTPRLAEHFARPVGGGSTGGSLLKLAALLHDVAKPGTRTIEPDGRMRFLGHAQEGAATAARILQRLRFSARETHLVETMVRYHLRPVQMSQGGLPTARAVYRYFRDAGEAGIETLFLSLADHLASRGPALDPAAWREHTELVDYVLTRHFERESQPRPAKLIDGHDLMDIFGMSPGPGLGKVLEAVREAQASGEIETRQEALDYVRALPQVREADDKG